MKRKIAAIFAADIAGYSRLMAEDEEETRRLADAASGWSAVAVGAARRPGLGLKQASEQAAVNEALSDCAKRDSDCRVVAIGPFTVGPN
ncbi:class 3 adenylate cyclase [Bradyrhizobium sp. OAE829]